MRIAITGGTGFVGRHVARKLLDSGHEVVLLARGIDHTDPAIRHAPGVTLVLTGLGDEKKLVEALAGCDGCYDFTMRTGQGASSSKAAALRPKCNWSPDRAFVPRTTS